MATPDLSRFIGPALDEGQPVDRPAPIDTAGAPDLSQFVTDAPAEGRAEQVDLSPFLDQPKDLGDEFVSGVSSGTDQLQTTLFGLMNLVGREVNSPLIQETAERGIARNQAEAAAIAPSVQSFGQIESFDDFFKWAAGALGQAVPSLGSAVAGGGVGGVLGKKAVEAGIRDTLKEQIKRQLVTKGITEEAAEVTAQRALRSRAGLDMVKNGMTRPGVQNQALLQRGFARGAPLGAVGVSAPPQAGEAALGLQERGIDAPGTALLAGLAGGALEALPALRLIDRMFPGVDRGLATGFIRDFAKATGTQSVLEGGTEAAQEMVQLAALAFHDPTFDLLDPENAQQVLDAFAAGALVGGVTGGGASVVGAATSPRQAAPRPELDQTTIDPTRRQEFPEGFEPADNTLFEEVRGRVDGIVAETLTPAFNTIRDVFQDGINQASNAAPGLNARMSQLLAPVQQAQQEFLEGHKPILDDARRFAREQIQWIYENASELPAGVRRNEWIAARMGEVQEQIAQVAEQLRDRATRVADNVGTRIDQQGIIRTPQEQIEGAQIVGDTDTEFVFGKSNTRGDQAVGFKNRTGSRSSARGMLEKLRERFPSATDNTFEIREQADGTFVVALQDSGQAQQLREDEIVGDALEAARKATRTNPQRAEEAARLQNPDGSETLVDVRTLVFQGRKLGEGDVQTAEQAFAAMAGSLLDRGLISPENLTVLGNKFDELFPAGERTRSLEELRGRADPREEAARTIESLTPQQRQAINEAVESRLDDEQLTGAARATRRNELRVAALENIDQQVEGGRVLPDEDIQEAGTEQEFPRDQEVEPPRQTRGSIAKPKPKPKPPKGTKALNTKSRVKVYMPGVSKAARDAVVELTERATKLLSDQTKIRVINRAAAEQMIQQNHEHAVFANMLKNVAGDFAVIYGEFGSPTYILADNFDDAGAGILGLVHEIGHVVHHDTWAGLKKEEQDKLWQAFVDDVESGRRDTGAFVNATARGPVRNERAEINMFEFREWMADQFVDWMNNRRQPRTSLEKFLEAVAAKLDDLWAFVKANPGRYNQLNQTYADFVDAVALKVAGVDPTGRSDFFVQEGAQGRPSSFLWDQQGTIIPDGATRDEWNALKKRFTEDYPAVARRATTITNWLHDAYYLVLAPSTSGLRELSARGIKSADKLVQVFNRREHGKEKLTSNYHQRIKLMKGQFTNRYDKIMQGMTDAQKTTLMKRMRQMDGDPDARPRTLKERQLRQLFDDIHAYLVKEGLPVGKIENYFPRTFSREKLINGESTILAWLMKQKMTLGEARSFYNSLIDQDADASAALEEVQADELSMQSPGFRNMRSRTAKNKFFDQFLDDNLDGIVSNYVVAATKRAEYNRAMGSKAPKGLVGGDRIPIKVWNPQEKLDRIMSEAATQGATQKDLILMKNYVDANLGMFGRDDVSDRVRTALASVLAYQNMRVLMFTVFASLPDMVGPAIRSGDMRQSFKTLMKNIKKVATTENDLDEMARAWGVVSSAANQHVLTEYVDNHYMPPRIRKWNDAFFKWTGLNWYTDFTRKYALAVGVETLQTEARKVSDQTLTQKQRDRAKQFLKEFGITKANVDQWVTEGKKTWGATGYDPTSTNDQKIAEALVQFVDESIMSPNASQRPIAASHPAVMLVYHLKGFLYAMHDTILKRLTHNFRIADTPAQVAAAIAPALAMLVLTAIGLELREMITGNRRTDRMDGWEYTWTTVERSGLLGITQLGFDFEGAGARGQAELAAIGGPTLNQAADLISRPVSQTIPKAIPIVSQLPWARDALRDTTPL